MWKGPKARERWEVPALPSRFRFSARRRALRRCRSRLRPDRPLRLLRVRSGLGSPGRIHGLLLIYANLLRDFVPLLGDVVQNLLGIFACPQAADALAQRFLALVDLDQRQIE